jgi:glycosyltransferase involved in cell wall biosynthesis
MNKIIVCIPTYKRPEMLKKLVISILECNIDRSLIKDVSIIIVDNDACKTAELVVSELKQNNTGDHEITYCHFPQKGLSNVRNELLKIGLDLNPDFLVFVDDDEFVSGNWLNELVGTIIRNEGDMGPVNSLVSKIPEYISYWLKRPAHATMKCCIVRTGNLIVS